MPEVIPVEPASLEARLRAAAARVDEDQMRGLILGMTEAILGGAGQQDWPCVMLALAAVSASFTTEWADDPEVARAFLTVAELTQTPVSH